jgi:Protein of unknown function (DUF3618)
MTYTEQLEHETEQARSRIADTLEELRACMTPGQVVNQLADRVGDAGARAFLNNLKRQTVDNPVPVALIGAGIAWLMLGGVEKGRSTSSGVGQRLENTANAAAEAIRDTADTTAHAASRKSAELSDTANRKSEAASRKGAEWSDAASRKSSEWSDKAAGMAEDARERISSAADRVGQSASDVGASARQMAGSAGDALQRSASAGYEAISESTSKTATAATASARAARQRTLQAGNALVDFCREQPLVLAGLGLAIGGTIGALLPQTETEDRLLGETSDQFKERAQDLASEQYEAAKKVGERALDAAQDETTKQAAKQEQEAASNGEKPGASVADEATLVPSHHSENQPEGESMSGAEHVHRP